MLFLVRIWLLGSGFGSGLEYAYVLWVGGSAKHEAVAGKTMYFSHLIQQKQREVLHFFRPPRRQDKWSISSKFKLSYSLISLESHVVEILPKHRYGIRCMWVSITTSIIRVVDLEFESTKEELIKYTIKHEN